MLGVSVRDRLLTFCWIAAAAVRQAGSSLSLSLCLSHFQLLASFCRCHQLSRRSSAEFSVAAAAVDGTNFGVQFLLFSSFEFSCIHEATALFLVFIFLLLLQLLLTLFTLSLLAQSVKTSATTAATTTTRQKKHAKQRTWKRAPSDANSRKKIARRKIVGMRESGKEWENGIENWRNTLETSSQSVIHSVNQFDCKAGKLAFVQCFILFCCCFCSWQVLVVD